MLCVSQFKTWNRTTGIIFCISFHGFGKVLLQETICFLIGDKYYPANVPSHDLGTQCSQWNVNYHIHPTLLFSVQGLNYAVRLLKTRYTHIA